MLPFPSRDTHTQRTLHDLTPADWPIFTVPGPPNLDSHSLSARDALSRPRLHRFRHRIAKRKFPTTATITLSALSAHTHCRFALLHPILLKHYHHSLTSLSPDQIRRPPTRSRTGYPLTAPRLCVPGGPLHGGHQHRWETRAPRSIAPLAHFPPFPSFEHLVWSHGSRKRRLSSFWYRTSAPPSPQPYFLSTASILRHLVDRDRIAALYLFQRPSHPPRGARSTCRETLKKPPLWRETAQRPTTQPRFPSHSSTNRSTSMGATVSGKAVSLPNCR